VPWPLRASLEPSPFGHGVISRGSTASDPLAATHVARHRPLKRELLYWIAGAVALSVAVGVLVGAMPSGTPATVVLSAATKMTTTSTTLRAPLTVAMSRPVRLVIPALHVTTAVGELGLQPDGAVMVPASTHYVGWYKYGPTPGRIGSSVILGHVDSYLGPGVFFELKELRAGNALIVTLADGVTARFVVVRVVEYLKDTFPDKLVYGTHGKTRLLNLVTCAGVFDHATGHYESNIVVFSRLVSVTRAPK
jgi:hypothetical protein